MEKYRQGDIVKINYYGGKIRRAIVLTPVGEGVNLRNTIEVNLWNEDIADILDITRVIEVTQKREDVKKWWRWL